MYHITNELQIDPHDLLSKLKGFLFNTQSPSDSTGSTPAQLACKQGDQDVVQQCILEDRDQIFMKDAEGLDLLDQACKYNHMDILQCLLENVQNMEIVLLNRAVSQLQYACDNGDIGVYELLCRSICFIPDSLQVECFLVHLAENDRFQQFRRVLLANSGELPLQRIFHVACRNNSVSIASFLKHSYSNRVTVDMETFHSICEGNAMDVQDIMVRFLPEDEKSRKIQLRTNTLHNNSAVQIHLQSYLDVKLDIGLLLYVWECACEMNRIVICTEIWLYIIESVPDLLPKVQYEFITLSIQYGVLPYLKCLRSLVCADSKEYVMQTLYTQQYHITQYILQQVYPYDVYPEHSLQYMLHLCPINPHTKYSSLQIEAVETDIEATYTLLLHLINSNTQSLLHTTVKAKDIYLTQLCTALGCNVNTLDTDFQTPLHQAQKHTHTSTDKLILHSLLEHPYLQTIEKFTINDQTLLIYMNIHSVPSDIIELVLHKTFNK